MSVGVKPAPDNCAASAIVKHPACAAPSNSSGFVADWPSSKRDLTEYGTSTAPLPTVSRPLPRTRSPFHSAFARLCRAIFLSLSGGVAIVVILFSPLILRWLGGHNFLKVRQVGMFQW